MPTEYRLAEERHISEILCLHQRYQVDHICDDDRADGFITTAFNKEQLKQLITKEKGLFIALYQDKIIGYAMAASWEFWSQWPMFAHMIKSLNKIEYLGLPLSIKNSYQYGPVCIDKSMRNSGTFEALFFYALNAMSDRYPILVTFINKVNTRSFAAHTKKVGLDVIQEFEYNNNQYYELAILTNRKK